MPPMILPQANDYFFQEILPHLPGAMCSLPTQQGLRGVPCAPGTYRIRARMGLAPRATMLPLVRTPLATDCDDCTSSWRSWTSRKRVSSWRTTGSQDTVQAWMAVQRKGSVLHLSPTCPQLAGDTRSVAGTASGGVTTG